MRKGHRGGENSGREGCGPDDARVFARLSGETYCFVVSVERPLTVMVSVRSIDAGRAPFPTENDC